ncbi:hypothetical protein D3C86_2075810 [compost metagenome]
MPKLKESGNGLRVLKQELFFGMETQTDQHQIMLFGTQMNPTNKAMKIMLILHNLV